MRQEFTSLAVDMKAIQVANFSDIPLSEGDKILPTHLLVSDKYTPDNSYDKMKSSLCVC